MCWSNKQLHSDTLEEFVIILLKFLCLPSNSGVLSNEQSLGRFSSFWKFSNCSRDGQPSADSSGFREIIPKFLNQHVYTVMQLG